MNKGFGIELESFRIIEENCDLSKFTQEQKAVVKRLIHTTGDFEFAEMTLFSKNAMENGINAIKKGTPVICDVNMVKTAVTKKYLDISNISTHCFITDETVIELAAKNNKTRAETAMDYAADKYPEAIYAVGNAPTALLRLLELYKEGKINPALVIGIPVGFVMAAESKEMLSKTDLPFITNIGSKGGSPCAAAAVNALIKTSFDFETK